MTIEWLLLLLPVAAASGWLAARRSMQRAAKREQVSFEPAYLKGLNYLLNEQPDRAIDLFVSMLKVDTETVETHLALGSLFRRRGEVDRAIRIHQNLIARPALNQHQRGQALLELGQDYMRAGLFDRAENLFIELKDSNHHAVQALTHLLTIYQNEKEWDRCLDVTYELEACHTRSYRHERAHYYCELAEIALEKNDLVRAGELLKKANMSDSACVRAIMLQGSVMAGQGNCKAAIRQYQKIAQQAPGYLSEVLSSLVHCYERLGWQKAMESFLRQHYRKHKDTAVMAVIADRIKTDQGERAATEFVLAHLQDSPDLHGLDRLISLGLDETGGMESETLQVLRELVARMLKSKPAYLCGTCGFEATKLHWQCPSCHAWDGIKPVATLV